MSICARDLSWSSLFSLSYHEAFDLQGLVRSSSMSFHETGQLLKFEKREKAFEEAAAEQPLARQHASSARLRILWKSSEVCP